jgi:xylulose-5-phosphate/fructose-6-phosphate phosphoketolase
VRPGYSLLHAYGAAFDNPHLIVTCIIGDGEAETGALATSWHSNKFLNLARDGAVLQSPALNGFKIANPTVLARISHEELTELLHSSNIKRDRKASQVSKLGLRINGSFLGPAPT